MTSKPSYSVRRVERDEPVGGASDHSRPHAIDYGEAGLSAGWAGLLLVAGAAVLRAVTRRRRARRK